MSWLDQSDGSAPFLTFWRFGNPKCLLPPPFPSGLKFCVFQRNFIHLFLIHLPQLIMIFVLQEIFNNENVMLKLFEEKAYVS